MSGCLTDSPTEDLAALPCWPEIRLRLALLFDGGWACEDVTVKRSVLVVDDDPTFRQLASRVLSAWGHEVIGEAGTAEEALTRVIELRPDTVLVDIALPDADGFSLSRQLSNMQSPPQVVLISTDAGAASEAAARRAGARGFVAKDELTGPTLRQLIEDA